MAAAGEKARVLRDLLGDPLEGAKLTAEMLQKNRRGGQGEGDETSFRYSTVIRAAPCLKPYSVTFSPLQDPHCTGAIAKPGLAGRGLQLGRDAMLHELAS